MMEHGVLVGTIIHSLRNPTTKTSDETHVEDIVRQSSPLRRITPFLPQSRVPNPIRQRRLDDSTSARGYQMLAISTRAERGSVDGSDISTSSVLTMATSATSTSTDPWSSSGLVEEEDVADGNEEEIVPKLEPIDDEDMDMEEIDRVDNEMEDSSPSSDTKDGVSPETPMSATTPVAKRPRGRPRKHPKPTLESLSKVLKPSRSKTGCITCRKRKKKCDEAKPTCMNCEKNCVECEGYPQKTKWKSGQERADEARLRRASSITYTHIKLPCLINGIETEGDRIFLRHYISRLSIILTLEGERDSAFRNILIPMAQQHSGLMHSLLALSSKHIDYASPYGVQILKEHPNVNIDTLRKRSDFHHEEALRILTQTRSPGEKVELPTYAQMICLLLETLSDSNPNGQHRYHLQFYQRLVRENPPEEGPSMKFIHEFFQYHIHADELIYLPSEDSKHISPDADWNLPSEIVQPDAVRMLGVFDGLFLYMSKITNIRNKVRQNMKNGIDPVVDYEVIYASAEIDAGIRSWTAVWPPGDDREIAGLLYQQMVWIYLWRTVCPPRSGAWSIDSEITTAVNNGISLLASLSPRDPCQTLALAPAFVIGCAAFEKDQREPIRKAIKTVKAYMEYKNTDTALEVLEEVWRLMDMQDERSWDWQAIAHGMGMDFLAT